MDYRNWTRLLAQIVTADGKVDYQRLADRRDQIDEVIAEFASISPESAPDAFSCDDERLAYWLNAYNAFTLHAIVAEYPITSVWKTRDGAFFQRRRHLAGGRAVSLNEIEHEILRGRFTEPRIHFAINCGSNGCPPMRHAAFEPAGLNDALKAATEQFLKNQWNCRIDETQRRIYVSRIFKMYAQDFAGDFAGKEGTADEYRRGVLAFVAGHLGVDPASIDGYEVLYNVYDWGLNDSAREPHLGPILFHEPVEHYSAADRQLRELHLYEGNFCNRACDWCTINGSPRGWYEPYSHKVLEQAIRTLAADGNLKFYGGEPTLHADAIIAAIRYLRARGFTGLVTVFSNGIKAGRLIEILESDRHSEAVLNYSIYHGRDAQPLPARAKEQLETWSAAHAGRIFKGYKVLFHAGAGADRAYDRDREADYHGIGSGCVRCFPVLTTKGRFHACPFAAEIDSPHYDIGDAATGPAQVLRNYQTFRRWIDETLDPAARSRSISSCELCHTRLAELPVPAYE
jgi:hypothetical protein